MILYFHICFPLAQLDESIIEDWLKDNNFFVPTKACGEVEKLINSQNFVVVAGHSGSGKTTIIQHIALKFRSQGWIVKPVNKVIDIIEIVNSPKNNLDERTVVVLNDPIGKESFDDIEFHSWKKHEETLKACLKKVKLLVSCRIYILNDNRVKGILKDKSNIVDICNDQLKLSKNEKKDIWQIYASNETITKEELTQIVQCEAYFPLLCKLYFMGKHKQKDRLNFFTKPVQIFEEEIRDFKNFCKEKYCSLILLVLFHNKLCIDSLRESDISRKKYNIALELCEIKKVTAPHAFGDTLRTLDGFFVKIIGDTFQFYHDFLMEITTYVFGKDYPTDTIKYADIGFLRKRVRIKSFNGNSDHFTINLSDEYIFTLGKRLFNDIFGDRLLDVVLNPCINNEEISKVFIEELERHPEKLKMLLEKKKVQIDNQDLDQISDHLLLTKLVFVSLEESISPLDAIIIFCNENLSMFCFKALQNNPEYLKGISLFPVWCCNGSPNVLSLFSKDYDQDYLSEKWNYLHPIHIVSAFHNYEMLSELIKAGVDVNLKTDNDKYLTPLTLAAGNATEEDEGVDKKNQCESKRNGTVQVLLNNGADVNLCMENGASPLYVACQEGHDAVVDILLSKGANINLCMEDGASPLIVASRNGHDITVKYLLNYGADINSYMTNGASPLFIACQEGHLSTVKLLLSSGANVNLCMKNKASPLHIACEKGYNDVVEHLLHNGAAINSCMVDGASPLYIACQEGRDHIVQFLLSNGAAINLCKKDKTSPLYIASYNGHDQIVYYLLNENANIHLCTEKGASPLFAACKKGHSNTAELLLRNKININSCRKDGASPLFIACQEGHCNTVKLLLDNGANMNLYKKNGSSPLDIACQNGHELIVQLLLSKGIDMTLSMKSTFLAACKYGQTSILQLLLKNGADINLCLENGACPLHIACKEGYISTVELLIKEQAGINLCMKDGTSPLHIACQAGHDSIVQSLLSSGSSINLCMEDGASPLHIACQKGHENIVQLLISNEANINLLKKDGTSPLYIACLNGYENIVENILSNEANVNLCLRDGSSPLSIACQHGYSKIVELLLNSGADSDSCMDNGMSPLYIACQEGHISIAQLLLNSNAGISLSLENGANPLHVACERGHDIIVRDLLINGADMNACMEDGASPLYIACQNGHDNIVQLLISNEADINLSKKDQISPLLIACQNGLGSIVQQLLSILNVKDSRLNK